MWLLIDKTGVDMDYLIASLKSANPAEEGSTNPLKRPSTSTRPHGTICKKTVILLLKGQRKTLLYCVLISRSLNVMSLDALTLNRVNIQCNSIKSFYWNCGK
jgi:hypothetical protein